MGVMDGKRGLVMGVANHNSIAHGCAKAMVGAGAEIAITYQGPAFGKRVRPLAEALGTDFLVDCDVDDETSIDDAAFAAVEERWGGLDFVLHAIAFSDKDELKGRYADTSRANFQRTMMVSCFSFTEVARRAAKLMPPLAEDGSGGGAMATLTYGGSTRVMPNYNVMGVAKAALESSVRYLASDFGPDGIRVNSISPGAVRTLAGAGIADARAMMGYQRRNAPPEAHGDDRRGGPDGGLSPVGHGPRGDGRDRAHRRGLPRRADAHAGRARRARRRRGRGEDRHRDRRRGGDGQGVTGIA